MNHTWTDHYSFTRGTHTPTTLAQPGRFRHSNSPHAHPRNVGGYWRTRRKPTQIWGECANSTNTVALLEINLVFSHQSHNETMLFTNLLYYISCAFMLMLQIIISLAYFLLIQISEVIQVFIFKYLYRMLSCYLS